MSPSKRVANRAIPVGSRTIYTHNVPQDLVHDLYHFALAARWPAFFSTLAGAFIGLNALFACLYLAGHGAIANQEPAGFWGAFFFSVETLATVGYGDMHPQTTYGHIVATTEIFIGMTCVALMTGLIFARFSRPRGRIAFARHPVVSVMNGKPTLMIRAANVRLNMIVDASAKLRLMRSEVTAEGEKFRRIHDLKLVRDEQPNFMLGWTLFHVIDEDSPLWNATPESIRAGDCSLILTMNGHDDSIAQTIIVRQTYDHEAIRWSHRYVDLIYFDEAGNTHLDYLHFHDTEAL